MTVVRGCGNCGDRSGWRIWQSQEFATGRVEYIWVQCQECNCDGLKAKPELCEKCGDTPTGCKCGSQKNLD